MGANVNTESQGGCVGCQGGSTKCKGNTPLHVAASSRGYRTTLLEYLLSVGADANARNDDGKTPLDLAITKEKKRVLREWMSKG